MKNIADILLKEESLAFLSRLLKKFPQAKVYLVGGMVRDIILSHPSKDYDFIIAGVGPNTLEKYLKTLGQVDLVGKTFGVYKFKPKDSKLKESIDIALPRTEHSLYLQGGYRDFNVKSDYSLPIKKDLERRDFTINAMAWDIRRKRLIDPMGGLADMAAEKIRFVGQAEERINEDYSRILRGLRFAVRLGFEFELETWRTIKLMMGRLNSLKVPREIVARELLKSFEVDPIRAIDVFDTSGAFRVLMPEVIHMKGCCQGPTYHSEGDVWTHSRLAVEQLNSPLFKKQFPGAKSDVELSLATFLHDIGKPYTKRTKSGNKLTYYGHETVGSRMAKDICKRLRLSSYKGLVDGDRLAWLIHYHLIIIEAPPLKIKPTTLEKYFIKSEAGDKLLKLIYADQAASLSEEGQPCLGNFYDALELLKGIKKVGYKNKKQPKMLLNGSEIMTQLGLKPGPKIGKILHQVRTDQLKKKIKTKKQALDLIKNRYGKKTKSPSQRRQAR
ncbi:HD domain-containing protein [Patescibacteria group bacterium]|nr:HD domain-containing protein [Patescibacteria group bacterium]MBU1890459.1 HD domain-containing protein [Patescibacteria group bacterium]